MDKDSYTGAGAGITAPIIMLFNEPLTRCTTMLERVATVSVVTMGGGGGGAQCIFKVA